MIHKGSKQLMLINVNKSYCVNPLFPGLSRRKSKTIINLSQVQ